MSSQIVVLVFSWIVYFLIHSLLASIVVKEFVAARWPAAMAYYRLFFNLLAVLLLALPLWFTLAWTGDWLWQWTGLASWIVTGVSLLAVAGFVWSLKFYDMHEFIGFRQLSEQVKSVDDQEHFQLSPLHRWVRHPWYFFALLLIWARDMNLAMLISSIMMTLYFIVGSWLEERKLVRYHGDRYRQYKKMVPGLVPLPWKHLSEPDRKKLLDGG
ncbi:MAG: hypothetical protein H8E21_09365 [Gammaproteobacteria bacterium]|nr:hypothetical protein [Gammaproteobacteria bacterium]MBL6998336.1 hypothetical protein [Gammaproteobacteria bacterium]